MPDAPENSLKAFRYAVDHHYGAELDVRLLADGNLGILHDSALSRTTGRPGILENLREEDLKNYHLQGSAETIPTLKQVLDLVDGKVPLIIELKPYKGNVSKLCARVFQELDGYDGVFCIESFNPWVLFWMKKNRPDVVRGQLAKNYLRDLKVKLPVCRTAIATGLLTDFLTRPDFIAYRFEDRWSLCNAICTRLLGIKGASWTLHSARELRKAREEGLWPIFENFDPATGKRFEDAVDT